MPSDGFAPWPDEEVEALHEGVRVFGAESWELVHDTFIERFAAHRTPDDLEHKWWALQRAWSQQTHELQPAEAGSETEDAAGFEVLPPAASALPPRSPPRAPDGLATEPVAPAPVARRTRCSRREVSMLATWTDDPLWSQHVLEGSTVLVSTASLKKNLTGVVEHRVGDDDRTGQWRYAVSFPEIWDAQFGDAFPCRRLTVLASRLKVLAEPEAGPGAKEEED